MARVRFAYCKLIFDECLVAAESAKYTHMLARGVEYVTTFELVSEALAWSFLYSTRDTWNGYVRGTSGPWTILRLILAN